jgi:hypothetical protein
MRKCSQEFDHASTSGRTTPSWVAPSFTTIELQAEGDVVLASYESAGFVGDVTLTPLG